MNYQRQSSYVEESAIHPLARRLKSRAGMAVATHAYKLPGSWAIPASWYFYYEFSASGVQGRGWHRFSPRKRAAARSFARAVVEARRARVRRARKEGAK